MIRAKEFNKAYSKLFLLLILLNWRVKSINHKAIRSGFQNLEISSPDGNIMDMAVGIIVGGAFTAIVKSMVSDILNPNTWNFSRWCRFL